MGAGGRDLSRTLIRPILLCVRVWISGRVFVWGLFCFRMSLGLPSRVFCSDLQNGSALQFGVSMAKNRRCSRWKFAPQLAMRRRSLEILSREIGFQFRIFGKGADELRLFIQNTVDTYGRASLREFSSRGRTSRPHCYVDSAFDNSMASITKCRMLKQPPAETANSLYIEDASSRVISEWEDAADRLVSQAGTSFLAVRCDADSSDKGKVCHCLLKPAR